MCSADGECCAALEEWADRVEPMAAATDALLFGGLAVLATGAVLTFVLDQGDTQLSANASSDGVSLGPRGRF